MLEISQKIEFSKVSAHLESLQRASNHPAKCDIFKKYYTQFQEFHKSFRQQNPECCIEAMTFYPILRLLLPDKDHDRPAYGIKTIALGKLIVRILAIDPQSAVAKRLMRKDEPSSTSGSGKTTSSADYASVVYEVMKNRASSTCLLTVYDVNQRLDNIARNNVVGDKRKDTEDQLVALFEGLTALDQKWLIRVILKNMHLGLGQHKMLALLRSDANQQFASNNSLKLLCISLVSEMPTNQPSSSSSAAASMNVVPGHPFMPMLCARLNVNKIHDFEEFYLETKMDGERFQIHFSNDRFDYFSRRCFDYTKNFGADFNGGSLTPDLYDMFKIPVTDCILDGEMMVWNRQERVYKIKAENTDVKSLPRSHGTLRPSFCVYDVLLLNGVCLLQKPYAERMRLLQTLIRPKIGVVSVNQAVKIRDEKHIVECLNEAFDNREEGVVIKRADSTYRPGERQAGWFKVKPDYIDGMITDFDLIVLGGYLDRSKTYLRKFQVGVYNKVSDSETGKFYVCCNVTSGLTDRQLNTVNEQLRPHWNAIRGSARPPMINFGTDLPDIWIDPRNSVIFEIQASELVKSSSAFATAYTLRFPRVKSVRSDKAWFDCCTLDELMSLCVEGRSVQKINKRSLNTADILRADRLPIKAKRSRGRLPKSDASLQNSSENISPPAVVIDTICAGLDFCVLNTNKNNGPTVQQLEQTIRAHGGNVLANPAPSTFVCIATAFGQPSFRVAALCRVRTHNIASVEWLLGALGGDAVRTRLSDFQPSDMICCTPELERKFQQRFDAYGDSYVERLDEDNLRRIIDQMDVETLPMVTRSEIHELEQQLDGGATKSGNFFRLATAHFGDSVAPWVRSIFEWHGGRTIDRATVLDPTKRVDFQLSHAIVDASREDDVIAAGEWAARRCVSYEWIVDSHEACKKMSEKKYAVKL